ncbi:MAG: NAD(P)/FAD-dependent oxidoreductase, partial [Myxococcota bacterium]
MNTRETFDVAIVGAGPSGATLACLLAKLGWSVALLERDTFPRDKLCGEFLSHEAHDVFDAIGVYEAIEQDAPRIERAAIFSTTGAVVRATLPRAAWGVSRLKLDETLFERARALGATCVEGAKVRRMHQTADGVQVRTRVGDEDVELRSRVAVGAYGRRARLDQELARELTPERRSWVGMKQHHIPRDADAVHETLANTVELHAFKGGYCGFSHVEGGLVNACALFTKDTLERAPAPTWEGLAKHISRENEALARRLDGLQASPTKTQAVAEVPFERKTLVDGRIFWVGDAGAMITPMTGDGQAMAVQSAALLAPVLSDVVRRLRSARGGGGRERARGRGGGGGGGGG